MESLYRKYRPQTFDSMVGQKHIVTTLENAFTEGRTAHAYLFSGPRGTGKTTTARLLAKALLCESGPTPHPCGSCEQCEEIAAGTHPDVYELDAASRTGVDNVREEIINRVAFAPTRGRYKVYIIDEVHMLTTQAFNALLKTLEEPPAHVVFVLCTTDPQKVPETILSRCQRLEFHRITTADIEARLTYVCQQEGFSYDEGALRLVAKHARGGLRDALSMLEQLSVFGGGAISLEDAQNVLGEVSDDALGSLVRMVAARDVAGCFAQVADLADRGADIAQFTRDLTGFVRNVYVACVAGEKGFDDPASVQEYLEVARDLDNDVDRIACMLDLLGRLESDLRSSLDQRLSLEVTLTRMARPAGDLTLESLATRVAQLERQLADLRANGVPAGAAPVGGAAQSAAMASGAAPTAGVPAGAPAMGGVAPAPERGGVPQFRSQAAARGAANQQGAPAMQQGGRAYPQAQGYPQQGHPYPQGQGQPYAAYGQPAQPAPSGYAPAQGRPQPQMRPQPQGQRPAQQAYPPAQQPYPQGQQSYPPNRPQPPQPQPQAPARPAPVGQPASQPAGPGAPAMNPNDPGAAQRMWSKVVDAVLRSNASVGAMLRNADGVLSDDGTLTVVNRGAAFAAQMLMRPQLMDTLTNTASQVLGRPVRVVIAGNGADGAARVPAAAPAVPVSASTPQPMPQPVARSRSAAQPMPQPAPVVPAVPAPQPAPAQRPAVPAEPAAGYEFMPDDMYESFADPEADFEPSPEGAAVAALSGASKQPIASPAPAAAVPATAPKSVPAPAPRADAQPAGAAGAVAPSFSAPPDDQAAIDLAQMLSIGFGGYVKVTSE